MLQTSDKSTKKPQLPSLISIVKTAGLAWACRTFLKVQLPNFSFRQKITHNTFRSYAANNQKNVLLSNAYSYRCVQNAECRLHTGGVGLSFLDRLIFLHSWWESNEDFPLVASVISRPATCQVSNAGEHFLVPMEVVLCWKLLSSTGAWHSTRFST